MEVFSVQWWSHASLIRTCCQCKDMGPGKCPSSYTQCQGQPKADELLLCLMHEQGIWALLLLQNRPLQALCMPWHMELWLILQLKKALGKIFLFQQENALVLFHFNVAELFNAWTTINVGSGLTKVGQQSGSISLDLIQLRLLFLEDMLRRLSIDTTPPPPKDSKAQQSQNLHSWNVTDNHLSVWWITNVAYIKNQWVVSICYTISLFLQEIFKGNNL